MNDFYYQKAKEAEKNSQWNEAARYWSLAGRAEDASACLSIAHAIALGDKYRSLTEGLIERWESRDINNRELYEGLKQAHDEVYGKR